MTITTTKKNSSPRNKKDSQDDREKCQEQSGEKTEHSRGGGVRRKTDLISSQVGSMEFTPA